MIDKNKRKAVYNQKTTKREALNSLYKEDYESKIIIESDKQRVNISIHSGLWDLLGNHAKSKSAVVEQLLVQYLSKCEGKEIVLRKSEF